VAVDKGKWQRSAEVFTWELHEEQNFLQARSVNKFSIAGAEHKVVLLVE